MHIEDTYKTLSGAVEGIFREKGSKFIAYAYPISSDTEIKPLIALLRAEHPKARHFCYAYRLGLDRDNYRVNDDGEPAGTAGRPILNCLLSAGITNVIIIVVRYFGGTLLGVPGLIHAYKTASIEAINNGVIIEKTVNVVFRIVCDYLQLNHVMKIIKEESLEVKSQVFDLECVFLLEIRKQSADQLRSRMQKIEGLKIDELP
jgi:uncharacterized YigZ family protein